MNVARAKPTADRRRTARSTARSCRLAHVHGPELRTQRRRARHPHRQAARSRRSSAAPSRPASDNGLHQELRYDPRLRYTAPPKFLCRPSRRATASRRWSRSRPAYDVGREHGTVTAAPWPRRPHRRRPRPPDRLVPQRRRLPRPRGHVDRVARRAPARAATRRSGPYDNVPVLSWLAPPRPVPQLPRPPISARYPIVELATGGFFADRRGRLWPLDRRADRGRTARRGAARRSSRSSTWRRVSVALAHHRRRAPPAARRDRAAVVRRSASCCSARRPRSDGRLGGAAPRRASAWRALLVFYLALAVRLARGHGPRRRQARRRPRPLPRLARLGRARRRGLRRLPARRPLLDRPARHPSCRAQERHPLRPLDARRAPGSASSSAARSSPPTSPLLGLA